MKPETLIEILEAAHLSSFIKSPFEQRGGIMVVGPPGMLKNTFIDMALSGHPGALPMSDLNVNTLMKLRESMISGRYSTIAFPEYEKLYARRADTASNVEGVIKQLIEEGFTRASFEDQDVMTFKCRALVIGAMTPSFYTQKIGPWSTSGFRRRFLWVGVTLKDPNQIMYAIRRGKKIAFPDVMRRYPSGTIPFDITKQESLKLESFISDQWQATPYVLLQKIFAVLKWKYEKHPEHAMDVLADFSESTANGYATIDLPEYFTKYRGNSREKEL